LPLISPAKAWLVTRIFLARAARPMQKVRKTRKSCGLNRIPNCVGLPQTRPGDLQKIRLTGNTAAAGEPFLDNKSCHAKQLTAGSG
jgi:hypothetical protein